jgi:uncharacterized DUF497 family protein
VPNDGVSALYIYITYIYYLYISGWKIVIQPEWDEKKNRVNRRKHGVWFEEAVTVFNDPHHRFFLDHTHSDHEDRYIALGFSTSARLFIVVHIYREALGRVRIISARRATKLERIFYETGI